MYNQYLLHLMSKQINSWITSHWKPPISKILLPIIWYVTIWMHHLLRLHGHIHELPVHRSKRSSGLSDDYPAVTTFIWINRTTGNIQVIHRPCYHACGAPSSGFTLIFWPLREAGKHVNWHFLLTSDSCIIYVKMHPNLLKDVNSVFGRQLRFG